MLLPRLPPFAVVLILLLITVWGLRMSPSYSAWAPLCFGCLEDLVEMLSPWPGLSLCLCSNISRRTALSYSCNKQRTIKSHSPYSLQQHDLQKNHYRNPRKTAIRMTSLPKLFTRSHRKLIHTPSQHHRRRLYHQTTSYQTIVWYSSYYFSTRCFLHTSPSLCFPSHCELSSHLPKYWSALLNRPHPTRPLHTSAVELASCTATEQDGLLIAVLSTRVTQRHSKQNAQDTASRKRSATTRTSLLIRREPLFPVKTKLVCHKPRRTQFLFFEKSALRQNGVLKIK